MATLGKAAGVAGAFVAGEPELVEYLLQCARTYIYTTAMPAPLAASVLAALPLMAQESWRRERLQQLQAELRAGLQGLRWALMDSSTPIQPLLIGDNAQALRLSAYLLERGLLVPAIRPPTVPKGTARLRISLSAAHTPDDVARLVDVLQVAERELGA
jgi:8-amino-7-oxononanoate synthase